jgi:hypothetical protein
MWKIDHLEDGESVQAVAPISGPGPEFTSRLALTNRRIVTIRSPYLASILGLARYFNSRIDDSLVLAQIKSVSFEGGFTSSLQIEIQDGTRLYQATGIGSRWLRLLANKTQTRPTTTRPTDSRRRTVCAHVSSHRSAMDLVVTLGAAP